MHACMYFNVFKLLYCYPVLEINFEEDDFSIIEGSPLNVLMQFRPTESPFTLNVRPVSIADAEDIGLESCSIIGKASRATAGKCT